MTSPKLKFLDACLFPRRVAENHIKASTITQEDFREGDGEVEGPEFAKCLHCPAVRSLEEQFVVDLEILGQQTDLRFGQPRGGENVKHSLRISHGLALLLRRLAGLLDLSGVGVGKLP